MFHSKFKTYWLNPSTACWYNKRSGKRANSTKQYILNKMF